MKKGTFSKVLIWFVIGLNLAFTIAVLFIFAKTGTEPSTLIISFFAFTSSELIAAAVVKVNKIKKGKSHEQD